METSLYFDVIPVCISKRVIKISRHQQSMIKENHKTMLHTKYQGSRPSSFRESVNVLTIESYVKYVIPRGWDHFLPQGHNLYKLGRGPLVDATYQISRF